MSDPEDELRDAIQAWVDHAAANGSRLFWALYRQARAHPWTATYEFRRLTGRTPGAKITSEVLDRFDTTPPGVAAAGLARTAINLLAPFEPADDRYWRLWARLEGRVDLQDVFEALTQTPVDHWQSQESARERKREAKSAAAREKDRVWLDANLESVRSGSNFGALRFAAELYAGYHSDRTSGVGEERLINWMGDEVAKAVIEGWAAFMDAFPLTWRQQARQESRSRNYQANYIAAAFADHAIRSNDPAPALSIDAAFGILRGHYLLQQNERQDEVQALAVAAIRSGPAGMTALLQYWREAVRPRMHELPHIREFEKAGGLEAALLPFLKHRPDLSPDLLRGAIATAARVIPLHDLTSLVTSALKRVLSSEAQSIWRFVAFLLDPAGREADFAAWAASWPRDVNRMPHGGLVGDFDRIAGSKSARELIFVRVLGPSQKPSSGFGDRDTLSEVVASSIKGLGETPTVEATEALASLITQTDLGAWRETLQHYAAAQAELRSRAEFKPPSPRRVAEAVNAGPPATAADLRAVARECLADLVNDIQNGDTAGWKAFWNMPGNVSFRTPREENDCRDLLLDRLRDRLMRFGMKAHQAVPEARRRNDRRADVLLIGQDNANLPVEAKRHMHAALWKAAGSQLKDYARSPGSAGHGVYLVFWFGADAPPPPPPPAGTSPIASARDLRDALTAHLRPELKPLTEVVVIDVAPPPARKPKRSTKGSPKAAKPPSAGAATSTAIVVQRRSSAAA